MEKILVLGNTECQRRRWWQRMRWLDSITDSVDVNWSKLQEIAEDRGPAVLLSVELKRVRYNLGN